MKLKMRIKQWLRDFLHPIVWDDLGLRVIKRELDDTWQVVQDLKYQVRKLIEGKEVMFNETDSGQTQYCPMCEENSRFTGLYDTCGEKIYYGDIVHWTDGGDDLSLEERIKTRWDRIAIVERLVYEGKERPEIIFCVIDSPSEQTKQAKGYFTYGGFIYKDTENYLTKVAESIKEYKNKFDNAGQCMAYVLEKRGVKC